MSSPPTDQPIYSQASSVTVFGRSPTPTGQPMDAEMTSAVARVGAVTKPSDVYDGPSPRVNSAMLPKFMAKRVRVPGKVICVDKTAGGVRLETSDGGLILISACDEDLEKLGELNFVEIVGMVTGEQAVIYYFHADMGNSLDLVMVDKVIKVIHDPRYFERFFVGRQYS